jgi:monovalent cation/proton antiporter MnhG/PhaG subunit
MTAREALEAALLVIGVTSTLASCLGVMAMDGVFARLHFLSAASTVGPAAIALAVVVRERLSATGVKGLVIVAILWISGPVLVHAIAVVCHERLERRRARA